MNNVYGSRLYRLAQQRTAPTPAAKPAAEHCELCGVEVGDGHRHLLDVQNRKLACACRACATLFDNSVAGAKHYQRIPPDITALDSFALTDAVWAELAVPVDLAFFFFDTAASRFVALYPGPMGAAEFQLSPDTWQGITAANPLVASILPDVQALLVNRTRGAREQWIVPIDTCYSLVGLIRLHWKGLGGGEEVWKQLHQFFSSVRDNALPATHGATP